MMKIEEILKVVSHQSFKGDESQTVDEVIRLPKENGKSEKIFWCSDLYLDKLEGVETGTLICSKKIFEHKFSSKLNLIICEYPRKSFMELIQYLHKKKQAPHAVSPSAKIHSSAKLGSNVSIGDHVVIERDCVIGDNTIIEHNTVIFAETVIGKNCKIGANNTIGSEGNSIEKNSEGNNENIPHLGRVVIGDHVFTGGNCTVDRGVIGETVIESYVKIGNLVNVAHGAFVGENTILTANILVAGSVKVGKRVWVGPCTSTIDAITIGDDVYIGVGSNVIKSVEPNVVVAGNPARKLRDR